MQRDRPQLHQALDTMRKGDVLVVWRLDRLARSVRQLVDTAADLHARGIELRSLHDAIDTSTATGRLTFHLFAALAEFERDVIRDRTAIGLEAARARGRKGGRPRKLAQKDQDLARALLARRQHALCRGGTTGPCGSLDALWLLPRRLVWRAAARQVT